MSKRPSQVKRVLTHESLYSSIHAREMDGQVYDESNSTNVYCCPSDLFQVYRVIGIVSIVILVPTLILQLIYICRSKSTFMHRQFLYTTIVLILIGIINIVYLSSGFSLFFSILYILNLYLLSVEILQITTIHLLLLYKFSKHIETRTMQRLQALCCKLCKNIETRPIQRLRACCWNIGIFVHAYGMM